MLKKQLVRWGVAMALSCASATALPPRDASACGGFFQRRVLDGTRRPSLSYEQTLIVFDEKKRHQHFIREVAFKDSNEPFGFVVPTPTRPKVNAVAKSPFGKLHRLVPFQRDPSTLTGQGFGSGHGRMRVKVLEKKRVGSFTAYVLAADDEKALAGWLKKHQLVSTPEADVWLKHYVDMKFFYVAMRYNPLKGAAKGGGSVKTETMRISFDTPLPYYPYFEPNPPQGTVPTSNRMLDLWVVAARPSVPVATKTANGKVSWVRPFVEGKHYKGKRAALVAALGAEMKLLPSGDLQVQTFVDQKRSRKGFGDVLFVAKKGRELDEATKAMLEAFLPVLDPGLGAGSKE